MRVEEIQVDGFGHLKDQRLTLTDGLVCVLGDNEAGKSTLLAFVRGILFGFTHVLTKEQRDRMGVDGRSAAAFDPVEGGTKGGSVLLIVPEGDGEGHYRFTRTHVRKQDGDLTITDLGRNKEHRGEEAERLRTRLLAGVDATVFGTVFAIGLDELHAIKALDKETVQGVLFAADAGIGAEVATEMEALAKTLEEHYKPRGQNPPVNRLKRELKEIDKEIRSAQDEVARHKGDQETYDRLCGEIRTLEERCIVIAQEAEKAEKRTLARTILHRINVETDRRAPFAERVLPTAEDRERHAELRSAIRGAQSACDEAKERLESLRQERNRIAFDKADAEAAALLPVVEPQDLERITWNAAEHRALVAERAADEAGHLAPEQRAELARLDDRMEALDRRVAAIQQQLDEAQTRLQVEQGQTLPEEVERRLRPLVNQDLVDLQRTLDHHTSSEETATGHTDRALKTLGPVWDRDRLAKTSVDHASEAKVLGLLSSDAAAVTRQPTWPTVAVGALLMALGAVGLSGMLIGPLAGAVLLAAGVAVVAIGLVGRPAPSTATGNGADAGRALATYGLPESTTRDAFRGFVASLRDAKAGLDAEHQAQQARSKVKERLRTLDGALRSAAAELGQATAGTTMDLQEAVRRRLDTAQEARSTVRAHTAACSARDEELKQVRAAQAEARQARGRLLAAGGIAPDALPETVQRAVRRSEERDVRQQRLAALQGDAERFARLERAFAAVQERRAASLPDLDDFPQTFRQVAATCQGAATAAKEADRLEQAIAVAEQELGRHTARLRSQQDDLRDFYARFAVADGDGFAAALVAAEERAAIEARIRAEEQRLVDLEANEPTLREDVRSIAPEEDARLLAGRDEEAERLQERLAALRESAKECYARLARVRDQDDLTLLLQRRDALRKEYDDAVRDWLRLGLTKKLLEKVRERYEREHGPRVLQEAGRLLARITDGRYDGIGREPDGSYVLTRPDGRRVPALPPKVSRATFAQVYLAIRLAYAEVHDGHGVPYLLDDVLSDFDDGRLVRAVGVLAELAERRQIVLFTHHRHVADAVTDAGLPFTELASAPAVRSTVK